jgi:hypothetical protein
MAEEKSEAGGFTISEEMFPLVKESIQKKLKDEINDLLEADGANLDILLKTLLKYKGIGPLLASIGIDECFPVKVDRKPRKRRTDEDKKEIDECVELIRGIFSANSNEKHKSQWTKATLEKEHSDKLCIRWFSEAWPEFRLRYKNNLKSEGPSRNMKYTWVGDKTTKQVDEPGSSKKGKKTEEPA